jgi:hypothetical protein
VYALSDLAQRWWFSPALCGVAAFLLLLIAIPLARRAFARLPRTPHPTRPFAYRAEKQLYRPRTLGISHISAMHRLPDCDALLVAVHSKHDMLSHRTELRYFADAEVHYGYLDTFGGMRDSDVAAFLPIDAPLQSFHICGSPLFTAGVYEQLKAHGIPRHMIHFSNVLPPAPALPPGHPSAPVYVPALTTVQHTRSGRHRAKAKVH